MSYAQCATMAMQCAIEKSEYHVLRQDWICALVTRHDMADRVIRPVATDYELKLPELPVPKSFSRLKVSTYHATKTRQDKIKPFRAQENSMIRAANNTSLLLKFNNATLRIIKNCGLEVPNHALLADQTNSSWSSSTYSSEPRDIYVGLKEAKSRYTIHIK